MSQELKPCPFCGSENAEAIYAGCGDWDVMCGSCATGGPWGATSKDSAIAAWNKRAQPAGEAVAWMRVNSNGVSTGVTDIDFYRDLWMAEGSTVLPLYAGHALGVVGGSQ